MNHDPTHADGAPAVAAPPAAGTRRRGLPYAVLALLIAAFAGLFLLGYLPRASAQAQLAEAGRGGALRPPTVRVALPRPTAPVRDMQLPGAIVAARETALYARTSGYVRSWLVDLGDSVAAGQLLA